jgi:putative heme-binding domain-containing protein
VNDYLAKANVAADRTRGELLYKQHCASCHLATPSKPIVGPPLENLKHWSIEQWVSAVLDPNRTLEPKYHQYAVVTSNGQLLSGLVENRTETSIILAISDGTRREIELSDIESIKDAGISLMPEGLETALSPDQLFDLLAFLRS